MERWRNKVAIVTGASSGIGKACASALLNEGVIVVALARRRELMESEIKAKLTEEEQQRYFPLYCDICNEESIKYAISWTDAHLGGPDILINNAGIIKMDLQIVSPNNTNDLKAVFDVNVIGVALCTREVFQSMKRRKVNGHIVVLNSILGHRVPPMPVYANVYPSSKFAVTAMIDVLRQEFLLQGTKIKITSISPGAVNSNIIGHLNNFPVDFPVLSAEDVADAVLYSLKTPPHVQIREIIIEPLGEQI